MNKSDLSIWQGLSSASTKTCSYDKRAQLLSLINYPWNKLLRYQFIKRIDLRFSTTPVHNDIYAHWVILLNAENISLFYESVCHHFVIAGNQQITHIFDEKRLALIAVLDEVQAYFYAHQASLSLYYPTFLSFKKSVLSWAYQRIKADIKPQFSQLIQESYQDITSQMVLETSLRDPSAALQAGLLKLGMDYETLNHSNHV